MTVNVLEAARLYLIQFLQGKPDGPESRHPWRKGWVFVVLHSLRVEAYAAQIMAREERLTTGQESTLIRLAAILHDIARLDQRDGHARRGAELAEAYLRGDTSHRLGNNEIEKVIDMIAEHSNKGFPEPDFGRAVLKDADTLDEIGAMSILMSGNWVESRSPFFFYDLRQRLIEFELPFCDQKLAILNTDGAREILKEKRAFVQGFIARLTDELQGDAHSEQLLRELSTSHGEQPST